MLETRFCHTIECACLIYRTVFERHVLCWTIINGEVPRKITIFGTPPEMRCLHPAYAAVFWNCNCCDVLWLDLWMICYLCWCDKYTSYTIIIVWLNLTCGCWSPAENSKKENDITAAPQSSLKWEEVALMSTAVAALAVLLVAAYRMRYWQSLHLKLQTSQLTSIGYTSFLEYGKEMIKFVESWTFVFSGRDHPRLCTRCSRWVACTALDCYLYEDFWSSALVLEMCVEHLIECCHL